MAAASLGKLQKEKAAMIRGLLLGLKSRNALISERAARVLSNIPYALDTVIKELVADLKNIDENIQSNSAKALGLIGETREIEIVSLNQALNDKNGTVRLTAAEALVKLGRSNQNVISGVLLMLEFGDDNGREKAAQILSECWNERLLIKDALFNSLKDQYFLVKLRSAEALLRFGCYENEARRVILDVLQDKRFLVYEREKAGEILGKIGLTDNEVIYALKHALKDNDRQIGVRAANALIDLGRFDEKILSVLIESLTVTSCIDEAAFALGKLTDIRFSKLNVAHNIVDKEI